MKISVLMLLLMTLITGVIYPFLITIIAQGFFPYKANGSIIVIKDRIYGSELLSQSFSLPQYFWPRPSAIHYNSSASGGSNLAPLSKKRFELQKNRLHKWNSPVPNDLLTTSASGLDPHISIPGAMIQIKRIAKARGVSQREVENIVLKLQEGRDMNFLGQKRVNVLKLNRSLDLVFKNIN